MGPIYGSGQKEKVERGSQVTPEIWGVGVPANSEQAEVLQANPGDRPVAKVPNPAVQRRQVARHHRHVSRVAEGRGR